jgi:hypothetical protein
MKRMVFLISILMNLDVYPEHLRFFATPPIDLRRPNVTAL